MDHNHIHITTIRNPTRDSVPVKDSKTFIQKTSFSIETEATLDRLSDAEFQNVSSIAENSQGGTFAQRARAAELQAARALRESKISGELNSNTQVTTSSSSLAQQGILTLKMPRRQKWTPLDLTDHGESTPETGPVTDSPAEQSVKTKSQTRQTEHSYNVGSQLVEKKTTKHQEYYSSTLIKPFPLSTIQSHDLSEYPAELGARISSETGSVLDLQMSRPMNNEHPHSSQLRAANTLNDEAFEVPQHNQNTYFNYADAQTRQNQQSEPANQFTHASNATSGDSHFYSIGNHHYYTQPNDRITNITNITMNPIPARNYPAVKGTPTAAENSTRIQSSNQHNLQDFQGQNYNPMLSQNFEHVIGRPSQYGNYPTAPQSHPGIGSTGSLSDHQFHRGIPFYHNQEPENTLPQGASNDQSIRSAANIPNNDYNPGNSFVSHGHPFQVESKYSDYEDELQSCVGTNPFERRKNLTRKEERAKMEQELDEWWTRDNRVPPREKRQFEEFVANERRTQTQNANPFGATSNNSNTASTEPELKDPKAPYSNEELVNELLLPAMANLISYKTEPRNSNLNPFGPPPSWAIDHTPGGNQSFFSQQWGQPPQRVGRDPRYRAMQHDGRSSVFEDPTGRFPREEFSHDRGRGSGRRPPF